jgi:glycosyltransferase 2 family protein
VAMLITLLVLAARRPALALHSIRATVGRIRPLLAERLCRWVEGLIKGLRAVPSPANLLKILALTAAYWSANALGTWVLALGFALNLTPIQAAYCVAVRAIGVTLPSGPGMVGTFQAFTEIGLAPFVPLSKQADAAAFANVLWAAQFLQQVLLGLVFLGSRDLRVDHQRVTLSELMRAGETLGESASSLYSGGR